MSIKPNRKTLVTCIQCRKNFYHQYQSDVLQPFQLCLKCKIKKRLVKLPTIGDAFKYPPHT